MKIFVIHLVALLLWFCVQGNDQNYSGMALIYIFDMILSADVFDTISAGQRGLCKRSDLAKMNELIQKHNIFLNCLLS